MMHVCGRPQYPDSRVNEIIADMFTTAIIVLAGIVSVAQFAYY
ncbi:MAG: hypothetical protein ACREHV_12465 [Rhizomicrobium sp.]